MKTQLNATLRLRTEITAAKPLPNYPDFTRAYSVIDKITNEMDVLKKYLMDEHKMVASGENGDYKTTLLALETNTKSLEKLAKGLEDLSYKMRPRTRVKPKD